MLYHVYIGSGVIGSIPASGIGSPLPQEAVKTVDELWNKHQESNAKLFESLKEDANSDWLKVHAEKEAKLGRMSVPLVWDGGKMEGWLVQPRFAVEQTRNDGSKKYRAVDHFSWSSDNGKDGSVNGHTTPGL